MNNSSVTFLTLVAIMAIIISVNGCKEDTETVETVTGDYTQCGEDIANNQIQICNSIINAVDSLCGFLPVDACECADEAKKCLYEIDWIKSAMNCGDNSNSCDEYVACLNALGASPEDGCDNVSEWNIYID